MFKKGYDERRKIPVVEWEKTEPGRKKIVRPDATKTKEETLDTKVIPLLKESLSKVDHPTDITVLRPKPGEADVFDHYLDTSTRGDKDTYRFLHADKTCKLFTEAFREHTAQFPDCIGDFQFDYDAEEQRTLCWREKVVCSLCTYSSKMHPLYEEIEEEGKRGRKVAAPNHRLQAALMDSTISNSSFCQILRTVSHPSPSRTDMQRQTNVCGKTIVHMNKRDMQEQRETVKRSLERSGFPATTPIPAECDARYNNPLFGSRTKTPFQPATQSTFTLVENVTKKKKIIGLHSANKLCKTASYLRSRGDNSECPDHPGHCSRNVGPGESIGNEELYAQVVADEIADDTVPIVIGQLTTDGDSHGYRGFNTRQKERLNVSVENLRDPRHLAQSQLRAIDNTQFSDMMFNCHLKGERTKVQRRFSIDLVNRCTVEYNFAVKEAGGDLSKLVKILSYVADAIIDCYSGHCGETCRAYSHVCNGTADDCWGMDFLPEEFRCLNMTADDETSVRQCINIRFGRKNLEKTRIGTSTQKCEATNRGYNKSNPKDITHHRNFPALVHSTAHRINHGPGKSALLKCEALGAPLPVNSKPVKQLKREDEIHEYHQLRQRDPEVKHKRTLTKIGNFKLYDEKREEKETYRKGLNDPEETIKPKRKTVREHGYCSDFV